MFNNLPQSITSLRNDQPQFKVALKIFICTLIFSLWMNFFACTDGTNLRTYMAV